MGEITERTVKFRTDERQRFWKRWIPTLMAIVILTTLYICEGLIVRHNTETRVKAEMAAQYEAKFEAYKRQLAEEAQAAHWLSGEASREAAINQSIDAVAQVIARLETDRQKLTEAACILARVMSPSYPDSFEAVCDQPNQWMFFDSKDKTFSAHDRELAETVVRPYMESGIVPDGLTSAFVFGEWTETDFVLRDNWERNSKAHYWRWS